MLGAGLLLERRWEVATWQESWSLSCSRVFSSPRIFPLGMAQSTSNFPSCHTPFSNRNVLFQPQSCCSPQPPAQWQGLGWENGVITSLITAMKATPGAQSRLSSGILKRKRHKTRKRENPRGWTSAGAYLLCKEGIPDWRLQWDSSWSDIF